MVPGYLSAGTISKQVQVYMKQEQNVFPSCSIVYGIYRAITLKGMIVWWYLHGLLVSKIPHCTDHFEETL